ncbi:SURF1 family protein [Chloroflexi bacterium TSY]|nr:SURF1 family protein [Chloroflexi bacterium TSY]
MWVLKKLINKRWWWATILVLLGMLGLSWLGVWQLERRDQRETYNRIVFQRWAQEPLNLNLEEMPGDLTEMEFRRIEASGSYDFAHQVALKNQNVQNQPGIQLLTPFILEDIDTAEPRAILIARGWVPLADSSPEEWLKFDEPKIRHLVGLAQESQTLDEESLLPISSAFQKEWFRADIDAIQRQMPYQLFPFFLYQLPEEGRPFTEIPVREDRHPAMHLRSPMMHTNYAVQWFSFTLILGFGYLMLVRREELKAKRQTIEQAKQDSAKQDSAKQNSVEINPVTKSI